MKQSKPNQSDSAGITTLAAAGVFAVFLGLASITVLATASRSETTLDPVFCSPSALHTTVEPPETQLTRDSAAIRILLKDANDHFTQIRRIYAGEIHVAASRNTRSALLQRGSRGGLFKPDYQRNPWSGSLRQEARRLDVERGTELANSVDKGIKQVSETGSKQRYGRCLRTCWMNCCYRLNRNSTLPSTWSGRFNMRVVTIARVSRPT
jgi:hypothetical protein